MKKLDPEELIRKFNLNKEEVFSYLDTHMVKEFLEKYNLPLSSYRCIINYWGGYTVSKERRAELSRINGSMSIATPEKLKKSKENGSRGYKLLEDVLKDIDEEEFISDYYTPLTKKELKDKYKCTGKMINKLINYFNLSCTPEMISEINKKIKTEESIRKQYESYKKTMQEKYNVDNYFQSAEFRTNIIKRNNLLYGVDWYVQSDEFREKYHKQYSFNSYFCDGFFFDSSYELIFWVYSIDHNIPIQREPVKLNYFYNNIMHTYYPDFLWNNTLVEIKGEHMLDENKKLIAVYANDNQELINKKQACMDENNVIIYTKFDIYYMFEYFNDNYNLEDFRVKYE